MCTRPSSVPTKNRWSHPGKGWKSRQLPLARPLPMVVEREERRLVVVVLLLVVAASVRAASS